MTKEEQVERNITLMFEFLHQAVKKPEMLENIPDGSTIEFIQKDIPMRENKNSGYKKKYFKVNYNFEET
jgi:hypothetical protein